MSVSINAICRKDRINQNRTTNIYLRFTVNRRSRYVSTGINIPADDWDFDTQTLKTQNPAVQLRIYEQIEKTSIYLNVLNKNKVLYANIGLLL